MKNIVGTPAIGKNFFYRKREINKITERLEANNNLQIAAPRRVGKTSILHYLKDHSIGGHIYIYIDTERIDTEQDFYRKILKEILKTEAIAENRKLTNLFNRGTKFLKRLKSIKVMGNSLDFSEEGQQDYYEEITNFLSGIELGHNQKLILLIDEFPQTILNIIDKNKGEVTEAKQLLQSNRELRLNPDLMGKIQFVYTGSIGLNHTVAAINSSAFVNDLNSIEVEALSYNEGEELINLLAESKGIKMEFGSIKHLLDKIGWLIPFHIQLAMQEIGTLYRQSGIADIDTVDKAFDTMAASHNQNHFEHYYSRLKSQFKNDELKYAEAMLEQASKNGKISTGEIYDKAVAFNVTDRYRQIIEILVYDGYINNNGDLHSYQFNSPLVRLWWQKFICK